MCIRDRKRTALLCALFLTGMSMNAQEYSITFSASGASSILETVLVENVTKGTTLTINGTDILVLNPSGTVGLQDVKANPNSSMLIYPNPSNGASTLTFNLPETGNVNLTINDLSGKIISQYSSYLESGVNSFQLPSIECGLYIVSVSGKSYHGVEKLMSSGQRLNSFGMIQEKGIASIQKIKSNAAPMEKVKSSSPTKKGMIYANGDRLKITGTSGLCKTILIDSIAKDKNIDFYLINCVDADGNAYPVTKIGSLYWMTCLLYTSPSPRDGLLSRMPS